MIQIWRGIMTDYKKGGIITGMLGKLYQEEKLLKILLKDKPEGFIMHHPFKREWIMKRTKSLLRAEA